MPTTTAPVSSAGPIAPGSACGDPARVRAVAGAITSLLADPARAEAMAQAGARVVVYCNTGERSAAAAFVLKRLLAEFDGVRGRGGPWRFGARTR